MQGGVARIIARTDALITLPLPLLKAQISISIRICAADSTQSRNEGSSYFSSA